MVKKIALEEHFLDPATEPYWRPTMVDVAPAKTAQLYASLTDFGEQRLAMMDKTGIARAVLAIAGPGVQAERDAATAVRDARASNDFLARRSAEAPRPLFRLCSSCHAGCQSRRRGTRALRPRPEVLWRHDQRPHATANISTTVPMIRSGNAPRRWARRSICIRPIRWRRCRRLPATTCWRGRCGAGAWRPVRMPCASSAAASSTVTRKQSSCSAISARRCRSSSGASTAARRPMAGICRSRRRNISRRTSG